MVRVFYTQGAMQRYVLLTYLLVHPFLTLPIIQVYFPMYVILVVFIQNCANCRSLHSTESVEH